MAARAPASSTARKALVAPTDPPTPYDRSRTALVRRARAINRTLAATYPQARAELDFETPLQLLVATILSAQTTDKRVNLVTVSLFARYPDPAAYAAADRAELEVMITPTGFFRAKTDTLIKLGAALVERFDGEVPNRLVDLVTLPGVGGRRPTSSWATRSVSRASPSTPTSAGWFAASDGPPRPSPIWWSPRSARCSRSATGQC